MTNQTEVEIRFGSDIEALFLVWHLQQAGYSNLLTSDTPGILDNGNDVVLYAVSEEALILIKMVLA